MLRIIFIGILGFLAAAFDGGKTDEGKTGDGKTGGGEILLQENFNYPDGDLPEGFWSEGDAAVVRNSRLVIKADTSGYRASTVWLDRELEGNLSIEFDVCHLSSADGANNINVFFMYSDPSGKPLRETAALRRDGKYSRYHKLNGYIITNVTNGDSSAIRYRFRENPGFRLLGEYRRPRSPRKLPGQKVHIRLVKSEKYFEYWEDDERVFRIPAGTSAHRYNKGLFGFRTWHTTLEIDNLLIKSI